jgi:hypothetical protein
LAAALQLSRGRSATAAGQSRGFSVTVCQDKADIDESVQQAKDRIAKNAANTGAGAPQVTSGTVIIINQRFAERMP